MQVVKRTILFLVSLWIGLVVFMPTKELYYALEKRLEAEGIVCNEASVKERIGGLEIDNIKVYMQGAHTVNIAHISVKAFLPFVQATFYDMEVASQFESLVSIRISKAKAFYSPVSPFEIRLSAEGSFGKAKGAYNLKTKTLYIRFANIKNIESLRTWLKQDEEGWYYEAHME